MSMHIIVMVTCKYDNVHVTEAREMSLNENVYLFRWRQLHPFLTDQRFVAISTASPISE